MECGAGARTLSSTGEGQPIPARERPPFDRGNTQGVADTMRFHDS
jgi:hypothetical protein